MDPITALSVTCNALQLFDVAFKLVSGAKTVYNSPEGMTTETQSLEAIADNVTQLSNSIIMEDSFPPALKGLGRLSKGVAADLLNVLQNLKAKQPYTKWESFKVALKTIWTKKQIQDFLNRIQQLQSQAVTTIQFLIMNKQSKVYQELLAIGRTSRDFGTAFHDSLENLRKDVVHRLEQAQSFEENINEAIANIQQVTLEQPVNLDEISTKLDALANSILQLQQDMKATKSKQDILKTFRFSQFDFRYNRVVPAHSQTLHWAFANTIPGLRGPIRVHLRDWLENGDGIFWLRGKAGSGKSTLMKFLCDHYQTRESLNISARNQCQYNVVISKYFFWNPGSPLQKSQEGLLRSIMFDILRSCPESIPGVGARLRQRQSEIRGEEDLWTRDLLREILEDVISENASVGFCFFIDGLDEYSGDSEDLINTVKNLVSHSNVKVCASSRPWAEFVHEFGDHGTHLLRLEDLNAQDIRNYVHETLFANSRFRRLAAKDDSISQLEEEIVTKSDGVFFWVYLVVKSLLEGMKYADSTLFLWKRLNAFPPDLDSFFTHMLEGIPEIYHCKTASTFKAAMAAISSMPALVYYFMGCVEEDEDFALRCKWEVMPAYEATQIIEDTALRLDGWTKGLLEVVHHGMDGPSYELSKVEFLHRTVRDYIVESTHVDKIFAKALDQVIDVSGLMCHGLLAFMKHWEKHETEMINIGLSIFYHASFVNNILWRMTKIHPVLDEAGFVFFGPGWETRPSSVTEICKYAAEYGLDDYIDAKLRQDPGRQNRTQMFYSTLLAAVVSPDRKLLEHQISSESQLATIKYLVAMGGSIRRRDANWGRLLESLRTKISGDGVIFNILCTLVSAGANLDIPFGASVFREEIKVMLPKAKAAELLALETK